MISAHRKESINYRHFFLAKLKFHCILMSQIKVYDYLTDYMVSQDKVRLKLNTIAIPPSPGFKHHSVSKKGARIFPFTNRNRLSLYLIFSFWSQGVMIKWKTQKKINYLLTVNSTWRPRRVIMCGFTLALIHLQEKDGMKALKTPTKKTIRQQSRMKKPRNMYQNFYRYLCSTVSLFRTLHLA